MIQIDVGCMTTDFNKENNNYNKITFTGSMNLGVRALLELQLTDLAANALRLALKAMPLVHNGTTTPPKHSDIVCEVPCRVYYKDALDACIKQTMGVSLKVLFLSKMGVIFLVSPIQKVQVLNSIANFDAWYTKKSVIQLFLITDYSAKLIKELDEEFPFQDRNDPVNVVSEKYISLVEPLSLR